MKKDNSIYLEHIAGCLNKIIEYTERHDKKSFLKDTIVQDAVIRQLEIIGEAAKKISVEFKGKHPLVPWQDMAGMRDKLIHDYIDVDLSVVWKTVKNDVPVLKEEIDKLL